MYAFSIQLILVLRKVILILPCRDDYIEPLQKYHTLLTLTGGLTLWSVTFQFGYIFPQSLYDGYSRKFPLDLNINGSSKCY